MQEYTDKNIKVLSDIEHIRQRAQMYIGEANNPHHLFSEAFDNAKDEIQSGHGRTVEVIVDTESNKYTVIDTGRGIPHGKKKLENGTEEEIIKILCTKSNSGGKFDSGESAAYIVSAGLHGVGMVLINALSLEMYVRSDRDGRYVSYNSKTDKIEKGTSSKRGTTISFIPDGQYFKDSRIIPIEFIKNAVRTANAFGIKTTLKVDKENIDVDATMEDLFHDEKDISIYHQYPIAYSSEKKDEERIAAFMRYTSDTRDRYYGYTNLLYNSEGGTHVSFIQRVICNAWEEYIRLEMIKTSVELHKTDYLVGLRCICACFISDPAFSSQTKERLSVGRGYFDRFEKDFTKQLVKTLRTDKNASKALIKRFEEYRTSQNKLLNRKQIDSLIKINEDKPDSIRRRSNVPGLIECLQTKRDNTEIVLAEGNSAIGPVTRTRDKNLQAGLPLRGKVMNVAGMDVKSALKSEVIRNITNALGCGIGPLCDASKRRYDRVIIATDSDEDGYHIQNLLLATFINLLPDIVKQGYLYIAVPPLYGWKDGKDKHFTNDLSDIPKGVRYTRYKGLGEMNDEEYKYCIMDKNTRNVYQVEYPDDLDEFNLVLGTAAAKNNLLKEMGLIREVV